MDEPTLKLLQGIGVLSVPFGVIGFFLKDWWAHRRLRKATLAALRVDFQTTRSAVEAVLESIASTRQELLPLRQAESARTNTTLMVELRCYSAGYCITGTLANVASALPILTEAEAAHFIEANDRLGLFEGVEPRYREALLSALERCASMDPKQPPDQLTLELVDRVEGALAQLEEFSNDYVRLVSDQPSFYSPTENALRQQNALLLATLSRNGPHALAPNTVTSVDQGTPSEAHRDKENQTERG